MATLAAHDQENVVRNLQVGPTGKPLNAGVKAFGAKTPGNKAPKTPFKIPLNDENAVGNAGKSGKLGGKGNGDLFMTAKKGGQLDTNAFVTPAGPRTRAPLGMKTTNAKSNAFKTPAPLSSNGKTQKASPRLRRPKVKIHQPELEAESEDDVPEVEYMPPKEIPLEDDMDDYLPKDWSLNINPDTMGRDILLSHTNPIEDDGRPRKLREFEEGLERDKKIATEEFENIFDAQMARDEADARRYFGVAEPKEAPKAAITRIVPKKVNTGVSTLRAKAAAAALQPSSRVNYAVPTATSRPRLPSAAIPSKRAIKPLAQPTVSRQATAVAASRSTIGYAQGRAGRTPPAARKPLSNVTKPAPFSATRRPESTKPTQSRARSGSVTSVPAGRARSNFSRTSSTATDATLVAPAHEAASYRTAEDEERELALMFLSRSDDEDDDAWMNSFNSQLQGNLLEDELDDFQFQVPDFS